MMFSSVYHQIYQRFGGWCTVESTLQLLKNLLYNFKNCNLAIYLGHASAQNALDGTMEMDCQY